MSDSFDPYRKWLGIPPEDQPPHYYRLLGLAPFESDADVITTAVDGRMALLKRFQSGQFSALSQRLMNEVALAKVCLLNDDKRAEYDAKLRKRLDEEKKPQPKAAPAGPKKDAPGAVAVALPKVAVAGTPGASKQRPPAKPLPWKLSLAILGAGVVIVGVVIALAPPADGKGKTTKPVDLEPPKTVVAVNPAPKPVEPVHVPDPPAPLEPKDEPKTEPDEPPTTPATDTMPAPTNPPSAPGTLADLLDPNKTPTDDPAPPKPDEPATASGKLPVPDAAVQQAAEREIREVFKKEFAEAKTPEAKGQLAATLVAQADETGTKPAIRYTLLHLASRLNLEAGNLPAAMAAVDALAATFDVQPLALKYTVLDEAIKATRRATEGDASLYEAAIALCDEAALADDYDTADRACKLAETAARRSKDTPAERAAMIRSNDLRRLRARHAALETVRATLAEKPDDPDANQQMGTWLCFAKGQWSKGLPHLAKGADAALAALAKRELTGVTDPETQVELADAWWSVAEKEPKPARGPLESHAVALYEKALPGLKGLTKTKVEKKLDDIAVAAAAAAGPARGVAERGNVAAAANGAAIVGQGKWEHLDLLIDGSPDFKGNVGLATGFWPCECTITLSKTYLLREIRLLLYFDQTERFYNFKLQVSRDGSTFTTVHDASQGQSRGWQRVQFQATPVRAIRLIGLFNSANPGFHAAELEAYCLPPEGPG